MSRYIAKTERICGALFGLFLGAIITPVAAMTAIYYFREPGGFIIDYAPPIILICSVIWGAFSGVVFGLLLLRPTKAIMAGLILAVFACSFLFCVGIIEKGLSITFDSWFRGSQNFNIGVFCFFAITALSSYVISVVNWLFTKKRDNSLARL
jgi:hypothetical protein